MTDRPPPRPSSPSASSSSLSMRAQRSGSRYPVQPPRTSTGPRRKIAVLGGGLGYNLQDSSRIGAAFFLMSEENVKKEIVLPWISFGSDEGSYTIDTAILRSSVHPRAYGNFARVIGHYVRENVITLPDAIRKLTKLSAEKLRIKKRGELKPGYYADIVIFDPVKVQDHATYKKPHQYATGVTDVLVNGVQVLKNSEPTDATPGRFVKGPGWKGK